MPAKVKKKASQPARKKPPKPIPVKTAKKKAIAKKAAKIERLDLSEFPHESTSFQERWLCLACVLDVFRRHMEMAPRTAQLEIRRYTPTIAELYAPTPM